MVCKGHPTRHLLAERYGTPRSWGHGDQWGHKDISWIFAFEMSEQCRTYFGYYTGVYSFYIHRYLVEIAKKNWYNMIRITRRVSDLTLPWWKLTIIPFVWRGDGIAYKKFWRWRNIWPLIWPNRNGSDSCPLLWYADFPAFLWRKTCDRRSANEPFHHNTKERYTKYFFTIGT